MSLEKNVKSIRTLFNDFEINNNRSKKCEVTCLPQAGKCEVSQRVCFPQRAYRIELKEVRGDETEKLNHLISHGQLSYVNNQFQFFNRFVGYGYCI